MNNAIITGGAGFIASHLAEAIAEKYDKIYLIDNLQCLTFLKKKYLNLNMLLEKGKQFHIECFLDYLHLRIHGHF